MTLPSQVVARALDSLVQDFFQASEGKWRSQRRYYTLKDGETQEVVSFLTVKFLAQGSAELLHLAGLHELEDPTIITCGALTTWESNYIGPSPKQTTGSTVFGVSGPQLYRDRGFSTSKPIIAEFSMRDPKTMCLRTEYSGNLFEEEIKMIGTEYRTRQTIIARAGEEQMIGQYLEKRLA
jgi:hypothetical protein